MKFCRSLISALAVFVMAAGLLACHSKPPATQPSPSPTPTPTPKPKPFIAYLKDGDLWLIRSDGSDERMLGIAPQGQTIHDFVWAADGLRLFYIVGLEFYEVSLANNAVAQAGKLAAQPGITIDRFELGRDGQTFAIIASDANTQQKLYAVTIGQNEARELAIDQFNALIPLRPPVIRAVGEISVSPDGNWALFKDTVGAGEELFVANTETGARFQISNLSELGGFEESVETEGGRRVMEAAWSANGQYVVFNPMQYCSEIGFCSGRLFLVETSGGPQLQLSIEMMVNVPNEWSDDGRLLVYDDGSRVVIADTQGYPKALTEGHRPKWQPAKWQPE
ncbi:MAG: TolB family protein [Blastocatellia bacterium]